MDRWGRQNDVLDKKAEDLRAELEKLKKEKREHARALLGQAKKDRARFGVQTTIPAELRSLAKLGQESKKLASGVYFEEKPENRSKKEQKPGERVSENAPEARTKPLTMSDVRGPEQSAPKPLSAQKSTEISQTGQSSEHPRVLRVTRTAPAPKAAYTRTRPLPKPVDCYNGDYMALHLGCREQIADLRAEFLEFLGEERRLEGVKERLCEGVCQILARNNFSVPTEGFLDIPELSADERERFVQLFEEQGCLDLVLQLCVLEDLAYNMQHAGRVTQRVGLTSQSRGLRKTYDVVYDI